MPCYHTPKGAFLPPPPAPEARTLWRGEGFCERIGENMRRTTCLRVLGLGPKAGGEELRDAYRAGVKRYHPDTPTGDPCRYMVLQQAYTLLRQGGPFDEEFEEELRRADFDGVEEQEPHHEGFKPFTLFEFPDLTPEESSRGEKTPSAPAARGEGRKPISGPLRLEIPPGTLVNASVLAGLVRGFLQEARVVLPPVNLLEVARIRGLSVEMGVLSRDYGRCNRLADAAVHAGKLTWENGRGHIVVEGLFNADRRVQRYVLAKMLGYALLVPGKNRADVLGELYAHRDDREEENAHRFAEELLLPEDMVSEHGGRVLGRLMRSRKLGYEAFLLRMEELFQVPSSLARRRLVKYEARLRILLHLLSRRSGGGVFDLCEDALY